MREQLWQVCKVYLTSVRWSTALILSFLVFIELRLLFGYLASKENVLFTVMPGVGIAGWMSQVYRSQFANYRARLIPGFNVPHLIILCIAILVLAILNPMLLSYTRGLSPLFAVSLSLGLLAMTVWFTPGYGFLPLVIVLSAGDYSKYFRNGSTHFVHTAILLAAACVIVAWLRRLTVFTEEMSDYETEPLTDERQDRAKKRAIQGTKKSGLARWISDRWHDRLPIPGTTVFQRFRLFHYGFNSLPFSLIALQVAMAATIFAVWITHDSDHEVSPALPAILWLAMMLPVAAASSLATRMEWMAQEGVLPITRRERIGQLFAVGAKNAFLLWLIGVWASSVVIAVRSTSDESESLASLVFAFACLSAALQVPVFGFGLVLALSREVLARSFGLSLIALGCLAVLLMWWDGRNLSPNWNIVIGLAMFLIPLGIFLIASARQLWLNAELG